MFGFPNDLLSGCHSEFMSEPMQFFNERQVFRFKANLYHSQMALKDIKRFSACALVQIYFYGLVHVLMSLLCVCRNCCDVL